MSDHLLDFEVIRQDVEGLAGLEERFRLLQSALEGRHPGNIIDTAKCYLESIFRTININHKGIEQKDRIDKLHMPQLFEEVSVIVKLSREESLHTELITIARQNFTSLARIRNEYGASAHGQDGQHISIVELQEAIYTAHMAVVLGKLFYGQHRSQTDWRSNTRPRYEDNQEFNEQLDELNQLVEIAGTYLLPSEILFNTDPKAYRNALIEFMGDNGENSV